MDKAESGARATAKPAPETVCTRTITRSSVVNSYRQTTIPPGVRDARYADINETLFTTRSIPVPALARPGGKVPELRN